MRCMLVARFLQEKKNMLCSHATENKASNPIQRAVEGSRSVFVCIFFIATVCTRQHSNRMRWATTAMMSSKRHRFDVETRLHNERAYQEYQLITYEMFSRFIFMWTRKSTEIDEENETQQQQQASQASSEQWHMQPMETTATEQSDGSFQNPFYSNKFIFTLFTHFFFICASLLIPRR